MPRFGYRPAHRWSFKNLFTWSLTTQSSTLRAEPLLSLSALSLITRREIRFGTKHMHHKIRLCLQDLAGCQSSRSVGYCVRDALSQITSSTVFCTLTRMSSKLLISVPWLQIITEEWNTSPLCKTTEDKNRDFTTLNPLNQNDIYFIYLLQFNGKKRSTYNNLKRK